MTEPAVSPAKPPRTWRPMVLWSVGLLLALGLLGLMTLPVGAVLTIRHEVEESHRPWYDGEYVVKELGGPAAALAKLRFYLLLPDCVAKQKTSAVYFMASCGEVAVPALSRLMRDRDRPGLRSAAAAAMGYVKPASPAVIDALGEVLTDDDPRVRCAAVYSLGEAGTAARRVVPGIEKLLGDPDETVRTAAAEALTKIRAEGPRKDEAATR